VSRPVVLLLGTLVGATLGVLLGACGGFECKTIDHPLLSGTYVINGAPFTLVFELNGKATQDYTDTDVVHAEYSVGPAVAVP